MIKSKMSKNHPKLIIISLVMTLLFSLLVGCGSSKNSADATAGSADDMAYSESTRAESKENSSAGSGIQAPSSNDMLVSEKETDASSNDSNVNTGHKIIKTGSITLETKKFDETISGIEKYATSIGGYSESSTIEGNGISSSSTASRRHAYFVFRVPKDKYSEFFSKMDGYGTVIRQQSKGEDVTERYFDTEARVKSLKIQEERILDILKKTDKLTDVIELERHLSDLRYQIENLTGTLRKWDNLVEFSTVSVEVYEVEELPKVAPKKSEGLGSRIIYSFTRSIKTLGVMLQELVILISSLLPFLVVIAVVVFIVFYILKKYKKISFKKNNYLNDKFKDDDK